MSAEYADAQRPLFEMVTDGIEARAVAGRGSGILVVVFSQVRVPAGRFGLSRLFARTRHACLFVNQPENRWYRGAEAAIDRAIDRAVGETGASRIILYGSSMGAFGALATAARRPAAEAMAFAPDFRVGEPGSQSEAAGLAEDPQEPGLAELLSRPRTGRVTLACPIFDPYDAGIAARLAALDLPAAVNLVPLASSHEVHDHLYSVNVIRRVIATFDRSFAEEAGSRGLLVEMPDWPRFAAFAALAQVLEAGGPVDPAEIAALGSAGNPGLARLEAETLAAAGRLADAEARLARLDAEITASPVLASLTKRYRKEIPRRRIALLEAMGDRERANAVRTAAAEAFPTDTGFAPPSRQ